METKKKEIYFLAFDLGQKKAEIDLLKNQNRRLNENINDLNSNQVKKVETKKDFPETKKLTYKLEYELKNLPKKIEEKETEIKTLTEKLSNGDFYNSDPDGFVELTKELKLAKDQLEEYEERWLELEELSQ